MPPTNVLRRVLLKLLRATSREDRAFTELFVHPYDAWVPWNSGLGAGAHVLYAMVRALSPSVIVEIGSARGKSSCALAMACKHNDKGKVYAIDPHTINAWTDKGVGNDTEQFLRARLTEYGLDPWCEVIRATSLDAAADWTRQVDLLFIDGDHTYEGVKTDFDLFRPWLGPDALVVFHDTAWESHKGHRSYRNDLGVPRFLNDLQQQGLQSITFPAVPGLTVLDPRPGGFQFLGRTPNRP